MTFISSQIILLILIHLFVSMILRTWLSPTVENDLEWTAIFTNITYFIMTIYSPLKHSGVVAIILGK